MNDNFECNGINCICLASGSREKNEQSGWHYRVRDVYSLYYITDGKGKLVVNGNEYIISAGQSFLVFPFSHIMITADKDEPWKYKWIEFNGAEADWLIRQTGFSKQSPVADKIPVNNFGNYFDIFSGDNDTVFKQCREAAKLFFLLSFYIEYFPREIPDNRSYAVLARDYIDKNYRNNDCNVKRVAEHIKIDRTYLFRLFKEETGVSVIDYIRRCRVDNAAIMLKDKNISIKDIAYSVGFSDQMYFSKVFKHIKGLSPTEYRKEYSAGT